jgi:hypothetical protein
MIDKSALVAYARTYLADHPEELLRVAKNVALMRLGIPLDALEFLAGQLKGRKAPTDVVVEAVPPGVRFGATVDAMGTTVRALASVYFDAVRFNPAEVRLEIRIADMKLEVIGDSDSPVAALIKSGALDLSKPGNLVAYMPKRPPSLVEAADDKIVIDLMRDPKLSRRIGSLVSLITPVVSVRSIETDSAHLDIYFSCFPDGLTNALSSLRQHT